MNFQYLGDVWTLGLELGKNCDKKIEIVMFLCAGSSDVELTLNLSALEKHWSYKWNELETNAWIGMGYGNDTLNLEVELYVGLKLR